MKIKQGLILIFAIGLSVGVLFPQEKEKLLFQEIPIVITASQKEQPITEAATTITVITSDDIRYSGATSIPDVLRMVAGVDVMTISERDQQVGVRGFITPVNNKLLALLDGRTIYTDLYGAVFWDLIPVGLDEIDRIEVVKSPASSMYGANAYCGVINIITKSPEQLKGTTLSLTGGEYNTIIASIIHAGETTNKKLKYKISTEWDQTRGWEKIEEKIENILRVNAMMEYSIGEKGKLAISAGRGNSKDREFLSGEAVGAGILDYRTDYLRLDAEYKDLKFRAFYKNERPAIDWASTGETQKWNISTYNVELIHYLHPLRNHSVVWGINFRYNLLDKSPFLISAYRQRLWALFIEDEIKISGKFRASVGARFDAHPLVKSHLSPRGSLLYSPSANHILRLSFSQAFRNPTFVDSYINYQRQIYYTLPSPLPHIQVPLSYITSGNPDLEPEAITAYEFGYRGAWSGRYTIDMNVFYNRYNDFFTLNRVEIFYGTNEIFPGSPGGIFPKRIVTSFLNKGKARGMGGEINASFLFSKTISGFVNYSYEIIKDLNDDLNTANIDEKDRVRPENPKNKINAGLRFTLRNGISLNILAHWTEKTQKLYTESSGIKVLKPVNDYLIINSRVGYTFWKEKAEIALSVFNLFNNRHFEYPMGENPTVIPGVEEIGRRFSLTLKFKF